MTLITEEYRALNRHALETSEKYATSGHKMADIIWPFVMQREAKTLLDYGAGRNLLNEALAKRAQEAGYAIELRAYDPCVPALAAEPEGAEFVTCTDVLEHIEPECLGDVLAHLRHLTRGTAFLSISTKPARNTVLADGRNPHLSLHAPEVWVAKLYNAGFRLVMASVSGPTVIMVVK